MESVLYHKVRLPKESQSHTVHPYPQYMIFWVVNQKAGVQWPVNVHQHASHLSYGQNLLALLLMCENLVFNIPRAHFHVLLFFVQVCISHLHRVLNGSLEICHFFPTLQHTASPFLLLIQNIQCF